jgi:7,8-dihydropterin-6-yl-methyl-4-(beta-D-ribofuranosyl)aminobenzene 5'-phosphate synthase
MTTSRRHVLVAAWAASPSFAAWGGAAPADAGTLRLTVVYDNVVHRPGLATGWGFACLVEGLERTLLFDTGGDGERLLANLSHLALKPQALQAVVLSHPHADHTGGLDALLNLRADLEVWLPAGFPASVQRSISARGARVLMVGSGGRLFGSAYSTGPLGQGFVEQALVLETARGLVVLTGCAHPGIVRMAEAAMRLMGRKIHLLMGGFHLMRADGAEIQAAVAGLQALGVERVAPSHCTGEAATAAFRQAWGNGFVAGGLGAVIEVPLR